MNITCLYHSAFLAETLRFTGEGAAFAALENTHPGAKGETNEEK